MRRYLVLFFVLMMVAAISLPACSKKEEAPAPSPAVELPAPAPDDQAPPPDDQVPPAEEATEASGDNAAPEAPADQAPPAEPPAAPAG